MKKIVHHQQLLRARLLETLLHRGTFVPTLLFVYKGIPDFRRLGLTICISDCVSERRDLNTSNNDFDQ